MSLAEASGLDPKLFLEAMSGGAIDTPYLQMKGGAIINRSFEPAFTVENALKDARLVGEAAERANVRLDVAQASTERLSRAVDGGHGDKDMAASYFASYE